MAKQLKKGDKVEWGTSQGKTKGVVKKKITSPMKIKGHKVKASKDNPEYLVESGKTGEKAAHKAEALKKTSAKKTSKKSASKKSSGSASAKKKSGTAKKSSSAGKKAGNGSVKKSARAAAGKSTKKSTAKKTGSSTSAKASKRTGTARKTSKPAGNEDEGVIKEFKQLVNIAPGALEKWLGTDESKKVGFKSGGKGESVGHDSGKRILKIKSKRRDKYTDEDLKHIHKVVGYIKRHLAQKPKGDISASNWRYSLMNWGHDPTK